MELRDYQEDCLTAIWNDLFSRQTALAVLSTGAGKSIIIAAILQKAIESKPDIRCLVLFNKVTLLTQLADRFATLLGKDRVGVYCGTRNEKDLHKQITVASIQSIEKQPSDFNLIIIDEVHAVNENDGRYIRFIQTQTEKNPKTKVVGFTATPFRHDGLLYGDNKLFERPSYERGLRFFIDRGYLVPPICKQPDHQIDLSKLRVLKGEYRQDDIDAQTLNVGMARDQVIDCLNRAIGRKKIVWQCASINHAELIKRILIEEGEQAVCLHSKMDQQDRHKAQFDFEIGHARHLAFVSIVSEGYDYPPIDCVVLMRPTRSAGIMVQTAGRGLRTYEKKENCLILDYANVIATLGPLEDPVINKPRRGAKTLLPQSQKACPQCRTYVAPRVMKCPSCGWDWPKLEATKLSLTADESAELLKREVKVMQIKDVRLSVHTSKKGHLCYKISYVPLGIFLEPLDEYFTIDLDFSMRRFILRAIELDIAVRDNPYETVAGKVNKKPSAVEFKMENKYPKILRLIF